MFYLSLLVVPSSRHDVVGDGPRAVPCDPEGVAVGFVCRFCLVPSSRQCCKPRSSRFCLSSVFVFCLLPFAFRLLLLPLFLSCPSYNPVYPDELVWTSTSCTPFLIAFASLFYYHIIIREKMLDTVFLIAYN